MVGDKIGVVKDVDLSEALAGGVVFEAIYREAAVRRVDRFDDRRADRSVNAAMAAGDPAAVEANRDYLRERVDDFDLFRTDLTQIHLTKRGIARG